MRDDPAVYRLRYPVASLETGAGDVERQAGLLCQHLRERLRMSARPGDGFRLALQEIREQCPLGLDGIGMGDVDIKRQTIIPGVHDRPRAFLDRRRVAGVSGAEDDPTSVAAALAPLVATVQEDLNVSAMIIKQSSGG